MLWLNLQFYPQIIEGNWVILIGGFWLSAVVFWCAMQLYFWPLLVEQENPRMLLAWRNAAYLILANPFYAFFVASFTLVLLAISVATTLPFVFIGMAPCRHSREQRRADAAPSFRDHRGPASAAGHSLTDPIRAFPTTHTILLELGVATMSERPSPSSHVSGRFAARQGLCQPRRNGCCRGI